MHPTHKISNFKESNVCNDFNTIINFYMKCGNYFNFNAVEENRITVYFKNITAMCYFEYTLKSL